MIRWELKIPDTDIHTLWYSGKGKYITWAGQKAVYFRKPDDPPSKTKKIEILDQDDEPLDIRGASWNDKETKLCFTAGTSIMVYDTKYRKKKGKKRGKKKNKRIYTIAKFKRGFGAEPRWIGNSVFFTVIEDAAAEVKEIKSKPEMPMPMIRTELEELKGKHGTKK